jgi:DNA-binding response OmpR family regulator
MQHHREATVSTVLVVEDDPSILDAVAFNLSRDGHEVLTAADGAEGLTLARERTPDLIVLDIMLPRMSGLDVCRIVRSEGPTPILLLTARDGEADRVQGLDLGADDYVTKPFSMRELRARVNSMLRRDQISRTAGPRTVDTASVLTAGELTLDVGRHELRRGGDVIALRPREFGLLEYLMRNPEQVLTRDMILEAVWDTTYRGETRTVDVHIRWLREKIEENPSAPRHILTVRSVGYKFVP